MRVYVGTYSSLGGAGVVTLELTNGRLTRIASDLSVTDPTYLILNRAGTRLFAASEGMHAAAMYERADDGLRFVNARPSGGTLTCHLCLSPDEKYLYAANYGDGSVAVFPVTNEGLGERIQLVRHEGRGEDPARQEGPHAHFVAITPDGQYLACCDLGVDAIVVYARDAITGLLKERSRLRFTGGLGVRHLAFDGDRAYAAHEMGNAVSLLSYHNGVFERIETYPLLTAGWRGRSTCAAIRLRNGFVYVSNRGHDSVSVLRAERDRLIPCGCMKTHGSVPRDFVFLPSGEMLIAHQKTGDVILAGIAENAIHPLFALPVPGAVCVCPAPF